MLRKGIVIAAVSAALVLSLSGVAYAADPIPDDRLCASSNPIGVINRSHTALCNQEVRTGVPGREGRRGRP